MAELPEMLGGDNEATQAAEFMNRVIAAVAAQSREAVAGDGPRLFFPEGIDVIALKFKIGSSAEISLTISGKACCKATTADAEMEEPSLEGAAASEPASFVA